MAKDCSDGLFGTCGVRGVVGETITDEVVERLGRAFGRHLGAGARVCIGRDTRPSGPMLEDALVGHLTDCGVDVTCLGVVSSPALYFLTMRLGYNAGVMITASHNPADYNGFKLCNHEGMCADRKGITEEYFSPSCPPATIRGVATQLDGMSVFMEHLHQVSPPPLHPLKLVVDCACGPLSAHLPGFLRSYGHEVIEVNCEADLLKCDRLPEPMPSTLGRTINVLYASGADAGLCFDGDSDRVVFLDREGFLGFKEGNAIIAAIMMEETGRREIVGTVESGRFVEDAIIKAGGSLYRTVVGDINVAQAAKERNAAAGVEECGHYVLPPVGYFSQTVYPSMLMFARREINAVRASLADLPPVYAAEERLDCAEDEKPPIMQAVLEQLQKLGGSLNTSDGGRVDWEDSWLLVRPSGTSPYMKVSAEAYEQGRLDELMALGINLVREALS